jgi:hypothetical protein
MKYFATFSTSICNVFCEMKFTWAKDNRTDNCTRMSQVELHGRKQGF